MRLGADSRKLYAIDLDGRQPMRTIAADNIDRADGSALVVGQTLAVLAAQAKRPIAIVVLEGHGDAAAMPSPAPAVVDAPAKPSTLVEAEPPPPAEPPKSAPLLGPDPRRKPSLHRVAKLQAPLVAKPATTAPSAQPPISASLADKVAAWRERVRALPATSTAAALGWLDARPSWRDELHAWTRAIAAGIALREPPEMPLGELVLARFELAPQLLPALALLYGAHLAGEIGAAPVDVARALGRRWDEALGRGRLAASGIATHHVSRVRLVPAVLRVLDELPAQTGALVGTPGAISLLGPCVVVGAGPLGTIASACLPLAGGAILAADEGSRAADVVFEAKAYGAVAMLRTITSATAIVVVEDEAAADASGLPRLA